MTEEHPAPTVEETAVANGGGAAAPPDNNDNHSKEKAGEGNSVAVVDKNSEEHNKGWENGTKGPSGGDVEMAETEIAKEGDAGAVKQLDTEDVKMGGAEDADTKEDKDTKEAEGEDAKMAEAEAGSADAKDAAAVQEDKDDDTDMDKQELKDAKQTGPEKEELKEQNKSGSVEHEEKKAEEDSSANKQEEEEAEEKHSADDEKEEVRDKRANKNEEKETKDGAKKQENIDEAAEEQTSDADNKVEENKEETPKNKKARSSRDRSQGKDKKQDGSKSREAKSLLNTPSPYGTDRPQRERKTVERLVEVIEKEPNRNFVVEKGRGTPLKDIPSVAHRISRKKPADLKFLHNVLFGRKGKTVDFKGHLLQFSGFVWHESDEKQRAKAKEKLDKCVKDMLLELCWLLAIPVPKANIRKEDIVSKLLDFIAEPHAMADSGHSDDQGSNSGKRKRGTPKSSNKNFDNEVTPSKKRNKAMEYDTGEDEDDVDPMKSDSEEDDYDSGKEKAKTKSDVKDFASKKKAITGSSHKTASPKTISKSPSKTSSSKVSKEKENPEDSAKVFSRKKKSVTPKHPPNSEKEIKEKKSSGKKVTKGKGESAEAGLPSEDELRKTTIEILKSVDFNTVSCTFFIQ
ncbi:hypothetical protein GUJ93_ZPchr0003g16866 [Zizania palustris]|uniref:DEK C-terminal domain-containing protein n=1 Tax=Zizania palustris TaxID=103762 RepID=A0A8J5S2J0_ZIZPA|nr:hypothetical protein GUJ93_ZPchr0003g16866 [Zizania palustris]KAG8062698.1 hypothetical protein GUJ93_ZPchr0003g16866 [Zizania palustris]